MGANTNAFLNRGERENRRLKKWTEKGFLEAWLWCGDAPAVLWKHRWHKLEPRRDRVTNQTTMEVWSDDVVCLESDAEGEDSVLEQRFFRHEDGSRKKPPLYCPMCRLDEAIFQAVRAGRLDPAEVIFHFPGQKKKYNGREFDTTVTIHAAGAYGGFRKIVEGFRDADGKTGTQSVLYKALNDKGIYTGEAWKEDIRVSLNYVMQLVDQSEPDKGLRHSCERAGVGNKLKHLIRQTRKSLGVEAGDPFLHPYCVRFEHHKDAKDPKDTYDAIRMEKIPLTEDVSRAIRGPGLDVSRYFELKNLDTLRAQVEQRATPALKAAVDLAEVFRVLKRDAPAQQAPSVGGTSAPAPAPQRTAVPAQPETEPCVRCKAPLAPTATLCGSCGQKYVIEDDPPAAAPPAATPASQFAGAGPPPDQDPTNGDDAFEAFDDAIPF